MISDQILAGKLKQIKKLTVKSQARLVVPLGTIAEKLFPPTMAIIDPSDRNRGAYTGFSTDTISKYENGIFIGTKRSKNEVAEVYATYCQTIRKKNHITADLLLDDTVTDKWLEKIWKDEKFTMEKDVLPLYTVTNELNIISKDKGSLPKAFFFRPSGTEYTDFRHHFVHIDRKKIKDIKKKLKEKRYVLLKSSKPASGKSVIVRTVAFKKYNKTLPSYFLNIARRENEPFSSIINKIIKLKDPKSLLIIENAHIDPEFVNDLLRRKGSFQVEILITSREFSFISTSDEKNEFDNIETIPIEPSKTTIKKMISIYLKNKLPKYEKRVSEVKKAINNCYKNKLWKDKVNLWLLSYALRALSDYGLDINEQNILSYVKQDIKKIGKFFKKEEKNPIAERILIILSVLSRYEIPTDGEFLQNYFAEKYYDPNDVLYVLDKLYEIGEITKVGRLYGLHHSALAELYFAVSLENEGEWPGSRIYGDEIEYLCRYIVSKNSINGFDLLSYLVSFKNYGNENEILNNNVVLKIDIEKLLAKTEKDVNIKDNSKDLVDYLFVLYRLMTTSNRSKLKEICEKTTKNKIAIQISKKNTISHINNAYTIISLVMSNEWAEDVLIKVDKNAILDAIFKVYENGPDNDFHSYNITNSFIRFINGLPNFREKFWREIDKKYLIKKFNLAKKRDASNFLRLIVTSICLGSSKIILAKSSKIILTKSAKIIYNEIIHEIEAQEKDMLKKDDNIVNVGDINRFFNEIKIRSSITSDKEYYRLCEKKHVLPE